MKLQVRSWQEQISELNIILKENSLLIFASFILTVLINFPSIKQSTLSNSLLLGSSYFLALFLMLLLLIQIDKKLESKEHNFAKQIQQYNYVLFVFYALLIFFMITLAWDFLSRYPNEIGITAGVTIGIGFAAFVMLTSVAIPVFVGKIIIDKAKNEQTLKDKLVVYMPAFLLLGICIPFISYKVNLSYLFVPIATVFTGIGWLIFIGGLIDVIRYVKTHKV